MVSAVRSSVRLPPFFIAHNMSFGTNARHAFESQTRSSALVLHSGLFSWTGVFIAFCAFKQRCSSAWHKRAGCFTAKNKFSLAATETATSAFLLTSVLRRAAGSLSHDMRMSAQHSAYLFLSPAACTSFIRGFFLLNKQSSAKRFHNWTLFFLLPTTCPTTTFPTLPLLSLFLHHL